MHLQGPLSQKIFAVAKELIPGGVNSPVRAFRNVGGEPFFVRRAAGSRIEDIDGKHYIDYIGSWGPNILGHAPVAITNTIHEVAKSGISFGIPNMFEVEMARTICDWVPSVQKVRMTSSGTEATMSAIRLARGFTKRDCIVKFNGCYHGHSDSLIVANFPELCGHCGLAPHAICVVAMRVHEVATIVAIVSCTTAGVASVD